MWIDEDRALVGAYGAGQALSDHQFFLVEPLLPLAKTAGRPRTTDLRAVLNALFYLARAGCQWRHLPPPPAFPPWATVYRYFRAFIRAGVWDQIHHHLVMAVREAAGREASPSLGIIDSQTVKTTEKGGLAAMCPATSRTAPLATRGTAPRLRHSGDGWLKRRSGLLQKPAAALFAKSIAVAADGDDMAVVKQPIENGRRHDGIPEHRTVPSCWIGLFPRLQSPIRDIVFMVNAFLWNRWDRHAVPTGSGSFSPMGGIGISAGRQPTWFPDRRTGPHCRAFRFERCFPWHICSRGC